MAKTVSLLVLGFGIEIEIGKCGSETERAII